MTVGVVNKFEPIQVAQNDAQRLRPAPPAATRVADVENRVPVPEVRQRVAGGLHAQRFLSRQQLLMQIENPFPRPEPHL